MKENCSDVPELDGSQSLLDLCFLADITKKVNELNLKLQEREKLITDCYEYICHKTKHRNRFTQWFSNCASRRPGASFEIS